MLREKELVRRTMFGLTLVMSPVIHDHETSPEQQEPYHIIPTALTMDKLIMYTTREEFWPRAPHASDRETHPEQSKPCHFMPTSLFVETETICMRCWTMESSARREGWFVFN